MGEKRTLVSRRNATIRKIVDSTIGRYNGRSILVVEAHPPWEHSQPVVINEQTKTPLTWDLNLRTLTGRHLAPYPARDSSEIVYGIPDADHALVIWSKQKTLEIVVSAESVDSAAISVATDALIEGDRRGATAALEHTGPVAGIAMAIVEAHAKTLKKGQAQAKDYTGTSSESYNRQRSQRKKSAAQLDREIAAIVGRR